MSEHNNNIVIEKPSSSLRHLVPSASWHFQPGGGGGVFVDEVCSVYIDFPSDFCYCIAALLR